MKHAEKLDIILRNAYQSYHAHKIRGYYDVVKLLEESDEIIDQDEARLLGSRLKEEGLVNFLGA